MKLIQKRVYLEGEQTPAKLMPEEATIYLNAPVWDKLPQAYKDFILLHEEGHFILNTYNEFEADKYAFDRYAGTHKGSLQEMWNTLLNVLPCSTREQCDRLNVLYTNIMKYNYEKTQNTIYLKEIERFKTEYKNLKVDQMINFIGRSFFGSDQSSYGVNYTAGDYNETPGDTLGYYPMNPPPSDLPTLDPNISTPNIEGPGGTNPGTNPGISDATVNDALNLLKNTSFSDIPEMVEKKDYRGLMILAACAFVIYLLIRK